MAGRKPQPTAIKMIKGNPGKRPIVKDSIAPNPSIPKPPTFLDKEAKNEWSRISESLFNLQILSEIDRSALAAYCQTYCRWAKAERKIKKDGMVSVTTNGNVIQSPYVSIANTALTLMHKYLVEFGMTPSSRSKVVTGEKKEDSPEDEFF